MLTVSVILYCIAAAGMIGLAAKYGFGPVPADYHAEILGSSPAPETLIILRVLYKVFAATLFALAWALVCLAVWVLAAGAIWASFAIFAAAMIVGIPSTVVTRQVEIATGVRTPWRAAAALSVLSAVAFVCSVI